MTDANNRRALRGMTGFSAVLLMWSMVSYFGVFPAVILPTPWKTFVALIRLLSTPDTARHIAVSVSRIFSGFAIASTLGVCIGAAAGGFRTVRETVMPLNSALRYIPPTSFIGLTIIWFGIGEESKIALIAVAILFYVIQMVADAVQGVPQRFLDAARSLGASPKQIFFRIVLPASRHRIIAALRINLGAAWTFLIVAEIVSAQSGLGYLMATSQRFLLTDQLFALLILVGTLGVASDALLAIPIRRMGLWERTVS
jgi:NitT/TauT family transport system permease protein